MNNIDLEKIRELSNQGTRETNNIIFSEMLQIEKLKSTWIGQIITIASTIIGGFAILKDKNDLLTLTGLVILFITIVFGLIKIINNINNQINRLTTTFEKQNDYAIKVNIFSYLEQSKSELSNDDLKLKDKIESEITEFNKEIGIVNERGDISNLSGNFIRDKITVGNYILIIGFAVGGLLIVLADKLTIIFK